MKEWDARITEDYVYIAETDHLLRGDIPNRAASHNQYRPPRVVLLTHAQHAATAGTPRRTCPRCVLVGQAFSAAE